MLKLWNMNHSCHISSIGFANFPLIPIDTSDNVFTEFWAVALRTSVIPSEILKSEIWQCQNMMYLIHNVEQADYPSMNLSVSVLSISRTTPFHHHKTPPGQLRPVEIHPWHGPFPMKKAGHEIFFNPLHSWLIQPIWFHMSKNVWIEKVISHK